MATSTTLINRFNQLPEAEQEILMALSILFAPVGQTKLREILCTQGCVEPKVYNLIAKPLREKLVALELLNISGDGWRCPIAISEILVRMALRDKKHLFERLVNFSLQSRHHIAPHLQFLHLVRNIRFYFYQGKSLEFQEALYELDMQYPEHVSSVFDLLIFTDDKFESFKHIDADIQVILLRTYMLYQKFTIENITIPLQLLQACLNDEKSNTNSIKEIIAEYQIIQGKTEDASELLRDTDSINTLSLNANIAFLEGRNEQALALYQSALQRTKKETRKRNVCLLNYEGFLFNLALLKSKVPENISFLKKQLALIKKNGMNDDFSELNNRLRDVVIFFQGKTIATGNHQYYMAKLANPHEIVFHGLMLYWVDALTSVSTYDTHYIDKLKAVFLQAVRNKQLFFAGISALLLEKIDIKEKKITRLIQQYRDSPFAHLLDLLPHMEAWERALQALTQVNEINNQEPVNNESRLVWLLSLHKEFPFIGLVPREQKLGKSGKWSKGRAVSLKRLKQESTDFEYLTHQDRRICAAIEVEEENYYYGYRPKEYFRIGKKAIIQAVGHPHIYWEHLAKTDYPVELKLAQPQLLVSSKKNNLLISLHPMMNDESLLVERTADNEILIYEMTDQHRQVAEILGKKGLSVPHAAKQQVIDSISAIASTLTVQSDIGGQAQNIASVDADPRLHVHLQPVGEGLQIEAFIQPFNNAGPIYKAAVGGITVLAEVEGKQVQTTRDFSLEKNNLKRLQTQCPQLYAASDAKWVLEDPEMALESLMQLQTLGEFVVLEWPKGQKIKVSREVGFGEARFSVRKEKDWFSVEGEINVDDEQVYDMQRLINLLKASSGRFLKLEDGQFIALTDELRQRLDDFSGLGEMKGKAMRFHALAAPALNEIMEGMEVNAGKHWQEQLDKLNKMADFNPVIPSTLQGDLRDYQVEGYQWMARLAHWGAGACLADDMGLGKTIQSLALILERAPKGAALILAPTSVCMNWMDEAQRFAPTLRVQHFGSGNREQIIADADAFDVIVCSYGLLQTESALLTNKEWHTIIADEAQALKNGMTKRSQAAMALQSDFKMITTGTPIENHLGELWNLFNFINPGLLGSLKKFNERFAQPIENHKDHDAQQRLKKLLRPFILRRLKTDVLKELPSRTEITLHVDLSKEERNFYEAMRRNAVEVMQASQNEAEQAGQQHLKVLAEIMKLRRACCHPKLVMEDSPIGSSKLQAFEELVVELIEGRHKALVFSQFVGHLTILRELLDKKGINYQYLDGSTSVAKRKKAVNAFQAGEGDVFLISLKAGGSGLNLTAADYVIHMDPWWNPAVEDQASDRAHRMGQKRPVTIYRLVAKDTIEDKIVDLHAHKRDLASSLLEGGEVSGKMSVGDMMALIKETNE